MSDQSVDKHFPFTLKRSLADVLEQGRVSDFYQQSDAHLFIAEVAARREGQLDIQATADRLGIVVEYPSKMIIQGRYIPKSAWTNELGLPVVMLNSGMDELELRRTFGHEVGHHFLEEVLGLSFTKGAHNDISEVFCEVFGSEMAQPGGISLAELEARAKKEYRIPADYIRHILDIQAEQGIW